MASSLIGSLRVALSLGTADFEAGANKAASVAKSKGKEIEGSFAGAKRAVEGLLAAFTVGVLTEQIKKSLDYAGSLAEVSKTLGVTTKDLQTFRYAAGQSGVAQDQLEVGLRRLTVSMGKAELGSKAQMKAFGALGITVADLKGKTTGDIFRMMSDSLSKVTDRSQRAAVEMALMGRSGSTLDNLLAPGSKRLNELAEAAQKLGIVLSDSQIQGAEETAHKLEAVKEVLAAQIASVVADNAQSILTLASALGILTGQITRFLGSNPTLALGIIGALAGKALGGGPIGIAIGAVAGATYGSQIDVPFNPGAKPNVALLTHNLATENKRLKDMDKLGANVDPAAKGAQVNKVRRLTDTLNAALGRTGPAPSGGDLPQFLGEDKKPKHAKKGPEDKTEQDEFEFAQQQRQLDAQILEAKKSLSHDVSEQAAIALQILDKQVEIKNADIDHKVAQATKDAADHKITQSTLKQIEIEAGKEKAKEAELTALQRKAILDQRDEQLLQQSIQLDQHGYDIKAGMLQKAADLATTAEERRKLELELLELQYKERRIILDRIIAESKDPIAVAQAQQDRAALDQQHALDKQGVMQQTRGPLEQWAASVPHTAAEINEALQSIEIKGLDGLSDAITGVITGTESLKSAFHNLAASILSDLIQMTIKMLLFKALQAAFGGGSIGSPDIGASMSTSLDTSVATSLPGGFASGGFVSGAGGPKSDSIPAMLSNGEYVLSAEAVRKFGTRFLDSLNNGKKAFADGGLVGAMPIGRTNYGGARVGNDNGSRSNLSLTMHNDFRGADPAAVASIKAHLDQLETTLPARIVGTMQDARARFIVRK